MLNIDGVTTPLHSEEDRFVSGAVSTGHRRLSPDPLSNLSMALMGHSILGTENEQAPYRYVNLSPKYLVIFKCFFFFVV